MALAWMRSMRSLTTLKLTSASSSARRICFNASEIFSSVRTACPRRDLKARWSFSWRFSNMRDQIYFSRHEDERRLRLGHQLFLILFLAHVAALAVSQTLPSLRLQCCCES